MFAIQASCYMFLIIHARLLCFFVYSPCGLSMLCRKSGRPQGKKYEDMSIMAYPHIPILSSDASMQSQSSFMIAG